MVAPVSAVEYHERTKHDAETLAASDHRLDWANEPTPFKVYTDRPSVSLSAQIRPPQVPTLRAIAGPGPQVGRDGQPDVADVTQLCYLSAGVTKVVERAGREHPFRAAACTGALYHVDLYLVTGQLSGLDAGVYHFDPRTLSLDVLRTGDYRGALAAATGAATDEDAPGRAGDDTGDATPGDDTGVATAPLTVVATSEWWRNAWKYRERTYRHAFWDAGTVLANLLAVAHSRSYPAQVVTGFADEAVARLLGVDPAEEAPVAMVPVGDGDPAPPAGESRSGAPRSDPSRSSTTATDPTTVEPIDPATEPLSPNPRHFDLIEAAYRASSLPDGAAARTWRAGRPAGPVGARGPGDGERVALAPVDDERAAKTPLHRTIRRRGSARSYRRDSLNGRKVATVLDRATRGTPMDVRGGPPLQYVDAYLVVHAVDGIAPGVYQYHPTAGELELLRGGEFRTETEHLALDQALGGDAALCLFFVADLEAVTEALGDRGYRVAQLEAALTAGRLYLAAYAHRDLGATGLTFYDDVVTEFLSPRADGQTPMFLWTLGRPG